MKRNSIYMIMVEYQQSDLLSADKSRDK